MKIEKKIIGNLEKCYALAPLTYQGKPHMLVAAEKVNQCRLYDLEGNLCDIVWEEPGGTMSMVQVPGSDGQFIATHKFYSPNDSKEAKLVLASPTDHGWEIKTLAKLPFVHRFDIITRNGTDYIIACTLKSGHEYKEDWRFPGKIQVCVLPKDLSCVNEENPLEFYVIKENLLKNHGYTKTEIDGIDRAVVASNEGVFCVTPPKSQEGDWTIEHLIEEPSSDAVLVDFDNDGEKEMLTISPFHGDQIHIFKKKDGEYHKIYTYDRKIEFAHAIWGGEICGRQGVLIGHRKGERDLLLFTCSDQKQLTFEAEVLDHDVGPANVLHFKKDQKDYVLSANREVNEIALYQLNL